MSPLAQFLSTLLGDCIGIAIALPILKRSRRRLVTACCGVFTMAFTLPVYGFLFERTTFGLFVLPLLGGALFGFGGLIGALVGHWFAKDEVQ
jgi:hypothetical protein